MRLHPSFEKNLFINFDIMFYQTKSIPFQSKALIRVIGSYNVATTNQIININFEGPIHITEII